MLKPMLRLLVLCSVLATGCEHLRFLAQATHGQLDLMARTQPIERLLRRPETPIRLRRFLQEIAGIKTFGEQVGLEATNNYQDYTQLDRHAAVWVVTGSAPLAFDSVTWSFPFFGSFAYLGWFDLSDAVSHAASLEAQGSDVYVRDATAYSTLGWFDDPILSTMVSRGPDRWGHLANLVLHESMHATLYVPGQSTFNESLASFVGDKLAPDYLNARFGKDSVPYRAYAMAEARAKQRRSKMHRAYTELEKLYTSKQTDDEKRAQKKTILQRLQRELGTKRTLNNAMLINFRTYRTGESAFADLFEACSGDWRRFLDSVRNVRVDDFESDQTKDLTPTLQRIIKRGC